MLVAGGAQALFAGVFQADQFATNRAYSNNTYSKGEFFLDQLGAVIGDSTLHRGLRRYFTSCGFKHPGPVDVQRAMEKESGLQLGWYFKEWINTTRSIDHAVRGVAPKGDSTVITLERKGLMLMPVDVAVQDTAGVTQYFNIPLSLMLGARSEQAEGRSWKTLSPWQWTNPTYDFIYPSPMSQIHRVELDPFGRLGDVDRSNSVLVINPGVKGVIEH